MPSDLCALSQYVAGAVGYTEYSAEAAIVNFYPPGSTLAGHTDHSEFDRLSPIISFRFASRSPTISFRFAVFHLLFSSGLLRALIYFNKCKNQPLKFRHVVNSCFMQNFRSCK